VCRITKNIQKLEILLVLLEGKLDSITWLEASPEDLARAKAEQEAKQKAKAPAAPEGQPGSVEVKAQGEAAAAPEAEAPVVAAAAPVNTVSKDPRYKKYFGLLERGVPKGALGPRMAAEGLDVKYLDTPDAPAPEGAPLVESSEEEEEMSDISD
jgi:WASH complex subunit CCDC53